MHDIDALKELIYVAPLSETQKTELLAELPGLPQETIKQLGILFAKREQTFLDALNQSLTETESLITLLTAKEQAS